jgi:hypothetical protein
MRNKKFNSLRHRLNKEVYAYQKAVNDKKTLEETQLLFLKSRNTFAEIKSYNDEYKRHIHQLIIKGEKLCKKFKNAKG